LALLLGAGVSSFYGLPEWVPLVNALRYRFGEASIDSSGDPMLAAAELRIKHFKDKTPEFLVAVHDELYRGTTVALERIRQNPALAAIGSLVMASRRGSASKVITFNYDDLLETYLEYHGFVTTSVARPRHWAGNSDVTIYHPHGYLPRDRKEDWSEDIIIGTQEYLQLMQPDVGNLWRPLLQTLMRTHSFIYIGLSGKDIHLQSLLEPMRNQHAIVDERIAFHGVRFGLKSAPNSTIETVMADWGVHTHAISSYSDIPLFLFKICQVARTIRTKIDRT
jgi:hypothetical protein